MDFLELSKDNVVEEILEVCGYQMTEYPEHEPYSELSPSTHEVTGKKDVV